MAWISKKVIQKKTLERKITPHPLLAEMEMSLGLKTAYVNGCVLAALLDDEHLLARLAQAVSHRRPEKAGADNKYVVFFCHGIICYPVYVRTF